ncbi:MAG: CRISPR-associated protein Cas4 [Egibacteraceae bacterium]
MALIPLRASDLRQWVYCRRIVYYAHALPGFRPVTAKMRQGREWHASDTPRERRRAVRFFGLDHARREFRPRLASDRLALTGIPDLVLHSDDETVPVEFKVSSYEPGPGALMQLTAYSLMLDETGLPPVRRSFVRNLPTRSTFELPVGGAERAAGLDALHQIRAMLADDDYPPPTPVRARCRSCEFRELCPDVW